MFRICEVLFDKDRDIIQEIGSMGWSVTECADLNFIDRKGYYGGRCCVFNFIRQNEEHVDCSAFVNKE